MEGGDHRDEDGDGRFSAFNKAVEGVKLKVAIAFGKRAPREWLWDV